MSLLDVPRVELAHTVSSGAPSSSPPAMSSSTDPFVPLPHSNTNTNTETDTNVGTPQQWKGLTAGANSEQSHAHAVSIQVLSILPSLDPLAVPFELELTAMPPRTELQGMSLSPAAPDPTAACPRSVVPLDRVSVWHDARRLFVFALSNIGVVLMVTLSGFFSTMLVGRLGAEYIGALTLARMITNLTGNNIAQGAASALEALCTHSYGKGAFLLVGRWTQRCMLLLTLMCIPTLFIWIQTERILLGLASRPLRRRSQGVSHLSRLLVYGHCQKTH